MASLEARQTLTWTAHLLAVAVIALPCASRSAELAANEQQRQTLDRIHKIEAQQGPNSPELIELFTGLSLSYRETGDAAFAVATIQRALHLIRTNDGLYSLDQVPLMQLQIQIEKQLGDTSGAWDLEHELLALLRRHPDDLRTVPILHEIADEQMDVLRRYVAGEFPPEVVLGCFYSPQPTSPDANCRGGSRRQVIQGMLLEARRNYRDATNVLVHNSLYSSDELRDLEMELLRGADWVRALDAADWTTTQAAQGAGFNSYYHGLQSLRRLYAYDVASTGSFTNRIDAIIQLADWELLYSHNGTALEGYEFARALLTASGASQASIDQRFAPEAPVVLPAFEPNPLLAAESQATGYVDVAFEVTTYGRSRRIDVRGGANASPAAKERVVHQIARSRFRPRLSDGEFGTAPLVVRYYLRN